MSDATTALRRHPLEGRLATTASAKIEPAAPASRISLRCRPDAVSALSSALGIDLPQEPKHSVSSGDGSRHALWIGPDEWLVIDETETDLMAACAGAGVMHSAVDISHRNAAILVSGKAAEDTLSSGCPQDLSLKTFPVGACSRTILGKAEIVLLRTAEDAFRVECWRSFSDYVLTFLAEGARDASV